MKTNSFTHDELEKIKELCTQDNAESVFGDYTISVKNSKELCINFSFDNASCVPKKFSIACWKGQSFTSFTITEQSGVYTNSINLSLREIQLLRLALQEIENRELKCKHSL